MRASRAIAMSLTLGLFAPGWSLALDTVVIGEDGDLDWEGEGQAVVTTIDAEHRSPLDPPRTGGGTRRDRAGGGPSDHRGLAQYER